MPRFFTTDISGDRACIRGDDARHIAKSLRMRVGEPVALCDLNGFDYDCLIREISDGIVIAEVLSKKENKSEPPVKLCLFQAIPKSDKLELIAQKAVELGVSELTPVLTSRCVSRWDKRDSEKKGERLQKIMLEAAKQSGRGSIPKVFPLMSFKQAVTGMKTHGKAILFYEKSTTPLNKILKGRYDSLAIMTGCEGGFSPEETRYAENNGVLTASLGPRILRCETAALCALSAISFASGEF